MEGLFRKIIFYYKEFIYRNIGAKRVLIWFVFTYSIYALILLMSIPEVMSFAGGMPVFNIMPFGYSAEYAMKLLLTLGNEGRSVYLFRQVPVDLFFPFLFAAGNTLLIGFLLNKINRLKGGFIYLCLIPVFASWFDYLENLGVMAMLINYPENSTLLIHFTSLFSVAKSLLITVNFVTIFLILLALAFSWSKSYRRTDQILNS